MNWPQALSAVTQEPHGQKSLSGNLGFQWRSFSIPLQGKKIEHTQESKRSGDFIHITPAQGRPDSGLKEIFSTCDFSWGVGWGGWKPLSEHLTSLTVQDVAKEAHFSLTPSIVLNHELCDHRAGRGWESTRQESRWALKECNPTMSNLLVTAGDAWSTDIPSWPTGTHSVPSTSSTHSPTQWPALKACCWWQQL